MKTGNIVLLSALAVAGIGLLLLVVLVGAWWFLSDQPTAMAAGVPAATATNPPASPPPDFPSAVSYELGDSEFASGDSITITELRGTAADIQPGGTYCVTGTYTLNSGAAADLSFYATTTNRTPTPIDPQSRRCLNQPALKDDTRTRQALWRRSASCQISLTLRLLMPPSRPSWMAFFNASLSLLSCWSRRIMSRKYSLSFV
jgi:hypothetical protein